MKRTLICMAVLLGCATTKAQSTTPEVVASSGAFFSSAAVSISWTAGESVVETFSAGGNILTQGFQQPENLFTSILETGKGSAAVSVYPNPAYNVITLHFSAAPKGSIKLELYDMTGKLILTDIRQSSREQKLDLSDVLSGMYLLKVHTENSSPQLIKIQKIN